MTQGLKSIVPLVALIAVLAMAPVAPEAGNALYLIAGAIGLLLMWPEAIAQAQRPIVWMPLAGLVLVAAAYGISAGADGLAGLLYFTPLLAIWPLVTLLQSNDRPQFTLLLGTLALCGVGGAAIMAIFEVRATGTARAGGMVANPIHFADVALMVGFVALAGVIAIRSRWRYLFLLAPVLAAVAVLLSGTRGAIIAFAAMLAAAAVTAALVRLFPRRLVLLLGVGMAATIAAAVILGGAQISGIQRVLTDISDTLTTGAPTDRSSSLRLQMYLGGFRAFLESPMIGHGPLAFTAVADGLADTSFGGAPHLHNDLADMAASAGLFGVGAYILFLLAPIVEIIRSPEKPGKRANVVLIATLVAGFFTMGLTNAMFGILTVTVTFAAICAITGLLAASE